MRGSGGLGMRILDDHSAVIVGGWFGTGPRCRASLLEAGEEFGIVAVGAAAYLCGSLESGWAGKPHESHSGAYDRQSRAVFSRGANGVPKIARRRAPPT
jgi:hypothetical protein